MNGESTIRTGTGGLASPECRPSGRSGRSSRAPWRRRLSSSRTSGHRASEWPRSIAWVVTGLALAIVAALPRSSGADDSECVPRVVELEPGKMRIWGTDGSSKRIDSSELRNSSESRNSICILEVIKDRPRYKVSIPHGKWKGVWLIKRRDVAQTEGLEDPECPPSIIHAGVEIRSERAGGVRAIGEEPCD